MSDDSWLEQDVALERRVASAARVYVRSIATAHELTARRLLVERVMEHEQHQRIGYG